jgi:PKD repeat protein
VLELMNFEPTAMVYLEDRSRGTFTNLREVQEMNYVLTRGFVNNRFFLHFTEPVTTQATAESCNQNDGKVTVNNPGASTWNLTLQSSTGEVVGTATAISGNYEFTSLSEGDYTLKLETDAGYAVYKQVSVEAGLNLDATFSASAQTVNSGEELVFTANLDVPNTTYLWNFGDQTTISGGAVVEHTYDAPGVYSVSLAITNGSCTSVTETSVSVLSGGTPTGIANTNGEKYFKLYPNPASDLISIQLSDASKNTPDYLEIQDAAGRTISREIAKDMIANGRKTLDVSTLANGVYQVVLSTKDGRFVRSFVVAH